MARSVARLQTADQQRKLAIRSAVAGARRALSTGLQKALADIGVLADGKRIPLAELPDPWGAAKFRPAIEAALDRWSARGYSQSDTITRYVREATYTWLNRLAAIRALSAHGLIAPMGRLEDTGRSPLLGALLEVAPVLQGAREIAEAALWQSVFEELAMRIGALFDPLDPHGILFPGSIALNETARALSALDDDQWRADDTLGWCYQFFTTKAERTKLRAKKASSFTSFITIPFIQLVVTVRALRRPGAHKPVFYAAMGREISRRQHSGFIVAPNEAWNPDCGFLYPAIASDQRRLSARSEARP